MIRIEDVPLKLLRNFCVVQRYGIPHLSVTTKDVLLTKIAEVDPIAEDKIQGYLAARTDYKIESLPHGRRVTRFYSDGTKRVFEERK